MSTQVCEVTRCVNYLGTVKRWARAGSIGDTETVLGKGSKTPQGSLRSLRVSSPVLVMVVVIFNSSSLLTLTLTLGIEVSTVNLGGWESACSSHWGFCPRLVGPFLPPVCCCCLC